MFTHNSATGGYFIYCLWQLCGNNGARAPTSASGMLSQVRLCLREHTYTHMCTHTNTRQPPSRLMRPLGERRARGREREMSRERGEKMGNKGRGKRSGTMVPKKQQVREVGRATSPTFKVWNWREGRRWKRSDDRDCSQERIVGVGGVRKREMRGCEGEKKRERERVEVYL